MTIRLLFDGFSLSQISAQSGIGTYQRQLLAGLAGRDDVTVTALAPPAVSLPAGIARQRLRRVAPGRFARWEHEQLMRLTLRGSGHDVFHSPADFPPRRPPRYPWVQTLFDVIPLLVDDPSLAGPRRWFERAAPVYRAADAVIAISRHAAESGTAALGLDPERVHVVPLAAGEEFTPGPAPERDGPPYILLVSAYDAAEGIS